MANNNGVRFAPCLTTHVTVTIIRYFTVHLPFIFGRACHGALCHSFGVLPRVLANLWIRTPHSDPLAQKTKATSITHLYSKRDKFVTIRCLRALSIKKYTSHIHVDDQWMIEGSTIVALIWCHKLWRWLRGWLVVWRRQGITWSDVYLPSICTSNTSNFHYTSAMKNWKQNFQNVTKPQ